LSEEDELIAHLYNATDNLVDQQFYFGGKDLILGRTSEVYIKIQYSGQIIGKFKKLFNKNIDLFLNHKYLQFINKFAHIKGFTDLIIKEIFQDLELKLKHLEHNIDVLEDNTVILYTMLLSAIISKIREIHFEEAIRIIYQKLKSQYSSLKDTEIKNELNNLYQRIDSRISILYNLSYLNALADTFNYKQVKKVCSIQRTRYINKIVNNFRSRIK